APILTFGSGWKASWRNPVAKSPKVGPEDTTTPPRTSDVPPPYSQAVTSTWLVESLMQLQRSISKLEVKVDHLASASEKQGAKLDSISHRVYAAAVVVTIAVAIIGFFIHKMWDNIFTLLTAHLPPAR